MKKATILLVAAFGIGVSYAAESSFNASQSSVSKEIQDFLDEEESYDSQTVPSKAYTVDVLGRKKSSNKITVLGKAKTSKKRKIRVDITNLDIPDYKVKTTSRRMEVDRETGKVRLWLNDKEVSPEELEKANEKAMRERPPFVAGYTDSLSAEEIKNLLKKNKHIYISKHAKPVDQMAYTAIFNTSQISTHAFTNSAKGNGVGIHFVETGCPHPYFRTSNYVQLNSCAHGVQMHPTGVFQVLSNTAPEATLYGQDEGAMNGPDQPWPMPWQHPTGPNYSDIFISSHSWGASDSAAAAGDYVLVDAMMDNYVYNTRIVSVVGAGNSTQPNHNFKVWSPGKALNAITVGAVDPTNDNYMYYSNWKNSDIGNEKPEVANYTNFEFNNSYTFQYPCGNSSCTYNGYFNGTSAAAPYTAAMIADLMSFSEYYSGMLKGHPELVKAILVSGEKRPIPNAASHDPNNISNAAKGIPVFSSLAWNRSYFQTWEGENNEVFDSNKKITFTEAGIKNAHYRIGIAWLTSGTYLLKNKRIAQDIDLRIYQNGQVIAKSLSFDDPFEVVDFTPKTNGNLTIEIRRAANRPNQSSTYIPPEKVILGYALWVDR